MDGNREKIKSVHLEFNDISREDTADNKLKNLISMESCSVLSLEWKTLLKDNQISN